ncbi:uncharacterized protein HfgLR_24020 (plasmid) [Haloferax gibbonsii]|uniref:Uncharacterized protein n=1 Tax=Haloferax gibbonsii TaxID=35746 RepID=A0A871BML0_HALGI|nr:uncharacterized protein HfgLR_24020 [Haloferax gibbonsii]
MTHTILVAEDGNHLDGALAERTAPMSASRLAVLDPVLD